MTKPGRITADAPQPHAALRPRRMAVIALGIAGAMLWLAAGGGRGIGTIRWLLIALGLGAALVPAIGNRIANTLRRIASPNQKTVEWTTLATGCLATAYLVFTAFAQDRDLFPKTHDDCSYAIGMRMLAVGRLWMAALPVPDFFESFYILVKPAYCSKYFPGTALFFVPTVWLHWPTWLLPAIASGACVAIVYRLITELIDGACGALAALMMLSLSWFRMLSVLLLSNVPMLLFSLLLYWSWLQWRKAHCLKWAVAMGAFAGWGAITRPIDAIAVSLPIAAAVVYELAKSPQPSPARKWGFTLLAGILGAAPFLALQIFFNLGVTRDSLQTPYGYYIDRFQPNTSFGAHPLDPNARVQSTLPQKQEYFERWVKPFIANHRPANLARVWATKYWPMIVDTTLSCRLLLIFLPIGLIGLSGRKQRVFFAVLPMFVLLYLFSTFFLEHYSVLVAPAMILGVLLGGREVCALWPPMQPRLFAAFAAGVVVISLTSFWEINRFITTPATRISDETFPSPVLRYVNEILPYREDVAKPAVVLFTYPPGGNFFEEPVYNTDVAWPDDAPVIRAHDLGARNREIFEYYARTQPGRTFYRFDLGLAHQGKEPLTRLGTARELGSRASPK